MTAPALPLLRVKGLCKSFGGVVATDRLDLEVGHGEAHAVIGPVIGAAALLLLEEFIPELLDLLRAGWGEHWRIVLGPLLLAIVLFAPSGLLGLLYGASRRSRRAPSSAAPERAPVRSAAGDG